MGGLLFAMSQLLPFTANAAVLLMAAALLFTLPGARAAAPERDGATSHAAYRWSHARASSPR